MNIVSGFITADWGPPTHLLSEGTRNKSAVAFVNENCACHPSNVMQSGTGSSSVELKEAQLTFRAMTLLYEPLKLIYDRQSFGQSVLVLVAHQGPLTNFSFSLKFLSGELFLRQMGWSDRMRPNPVIVIPLTWRTQLNKCPSPEDGARFSSQNVLLIFEMSNAGKNMRSFVFFLF
jgi:hypothetical protein